MGLTSNKITNPKGCHTLVSSPHRWQFGQRQCRRKATIEVDEKLYCSLHANNRLS